MIFYTNTSLITTNTIKDGTYIENDSILRLA